MWDFCASAIIQINYRNNNNNNLTPNLLFNWKPQQYIAVNADECLMTRMQEMSLDYHFTVEQEVGSSTYAFFGFNGKKERKKSTLFLGKKKTKIFFSFKVLNVITFTGTAGVWRMAAIDEAGGWKDRTTVEDMDLAVRASLKGWRFLYLGDIKVHIHTYTYIN